MLKEFFDLILRILEGISDNKTATFFIIVILVFFAGLIHNRINERDGGLDTYVKGNMWDLPTKSKVVKWISRVFFILILFVFGIIGIGAVFLLLKIIWLTLQLIFT